MSLTVSYCFYLSQTVSPVPWSYYMSITISSSSMEFLHVSYCLLWLLAFSHCLYQYHGVAASLSLSPIWLLAFSLTAIEFLHVSNCLPWFLAVSHCFSGPLELLHVFCFLLWLLAVFHCLS